MYKLVGPLGHKCATTTSTKEQQQREKPQPTKRDNNNSKAHHLPVAILRHPVWAPAPRCSSCPRGHGVVVVARLGPRLATRLSTRLATRLDARLAPGMARAEFWRWSPNCSDCAQKGNIAGCTHRRHFPDAYTRFSGARGRQLSPTRNGRPRCKIHRDIARPQHTQEGGPADCELDHARPIVQGRVHNAP